ncbi:MAG: ATP-dependent DNA helicase RecG [Flavobacteriales bacterium]|nr:MAG: ATP-dependent DNA helicase RecG [Flavobacteriales bacterium]
MNNDFINQSIEFVKGIGPSRSKLLTEELNIKTVKDLIDFYPYRYIDRSRFFKINEIPKNQSEVQIIGKIRSIRRTKVKFRDRLNCVFYDDTGKVDLIWYRGFNWVEESLKVNEEYVIYGKVNWFGTNCSIAHPEIKTRNSFNKNIPRRLHGVYSSTEKLVNEGVTQKYFVKIIFNLLNVLQNQIKENLSSSILNDFKLIGRYKAIVNIHLPESQELLTESTRRLKFEELFFNQLGFQLTKNDRIQKLSGFKFEKVGDNLNKFYKHNLPFELTGDQKKVIKEIRNDFRDGKQMNRLLQGDVGSGKTIVSLMIMLIAIDNGFQSSILAPTEILANQHYKSLNELLSDFDIKVELLTGSVKAKDRKSIHKNLLSGKTNILVGTHAILEDIVQFKNLGLSIIDEQHRFGVAQRAKLWKKNNPPPHILVMTATPIPRTLAMSLYGDLDISSIKELPPGRITTKTVHKYDKNRLSVFKFIRGQIKKGRQIYLVYPLINESEKLDYKDLMDGYESVVREFPRPDYQVSIVHGKMSGKDKDFEMKRFINKETQILVSTTVIEVGVNVPNASVMVIESAERFGLSQLHQLRGRVGRGNEESYCILMTKDKLSEESMLRIDTMVNVSDGFKLAEVDLKIRGPGDILGTKQSGVLKFKLADIIYDTKILNNARLCAINILENDPRLIKKENLPIRNELSSSSNSKNLWRYIS